MPVEIKELIIRTNIVSDQQNRNDTNNGKLSPKEKREIIEACADKVVRLIKRQNER